VIPSYEEGFPRTIWEAMANSLPVVATTVGAIPRYLSHQKDAILIKPKSTTDIANAIIALIENTELRKTLIRNGMIQAENNTLEFQTKQLLTIINQLT
jgi:glycosyltransferase involved in cell wall biosynthesis